MHSPLRPLFFVSAALLLLGLPAAATTYMMVSDAKLAEQASSIAEVSIESADNSPAEGMPSTDYLVSVERVIKGSLPGSSLIVRVPGGQGPDGLVLKIWGMPEFTAGDRALLFLHPNEDGSFSILHLLLGAFREVQDGKGSWLALRDLSEAHAVSLPGAVDSIGQPEEHAVRDLVRFRDWLTDRSFGIKRKADYFTSAQGLTNAHDPATFFTNGGNRMRWFEFDQGQSIPWRANSAGQPSVNGGGFAEFQTAINAWNSAASTNIRYSYAGRTDATAGLDNFDGTNAILFDHTLSSAFDCDTGGVLAIGGPWYDPNTRRTANGETFIVIGGGDIVTNAGLGCFFEQSRNPSKAAEELFTHELGHTLGLGHSCGDSASGPCINAARNDAIMRANVHDDGRGARLGSDDLAGIQSLYPGNSGGPGRGGRGPTAPGNVKATVTGHAVRLTWEDRSPNERGFKVYRGLNGGALALIATLPINAKAYNDPNLTPNGRYVYQVSSFNNKGETLAAQVTARIGR